MRNECDFHGQTSEFPEYMPKRHPFVQPDWREDDGRSPSYIRNKPLVIETINGVHANHSGDVDIKKILFVDTLSNEELYVIASKAFGDDM